MAKNKDRAIVLDIDLDFFLSNKPDGPKDPRYALEDCKPWDDVDFREFLTKRCRLSTEHKTPGYLIRTHDQAFTIWAELIRLGELQTPFEVYHIDSHADLGCGYGTKIEPLCNEILHFSPENRLQLLVERNFVNEANFLLMSVAMRWIKKIYYVAHPELIEGPASEPDYPYLGLLIKPRKGLSKMQCNIQLFETSCWGVINIHNPPIKNLEPPVPIDIVRLEQFTLPAKPHHVTFCLSPKYTPPETDRLMEIAREYICQPDSQAAFPDFMDIDIEQAPKPATAKTGWR